MTHTSKMRQQRRKMINELKVKFGCVDCGIKNIAVLDWHHESERRLGGKTVGQLISETASMKLIMEEIEKCIVLCANCHRIRHYEGE